jgi:Rad3-related DNA helicase
MKQLPLQNSVENIFAESLPRLFGGGYERRAEQVSMARVVAETVENGGIGLIEAGTGLGKSLAYLVPLVLHCLRTGERAVVSTYTKNLQTQLIAKDFPAALRAARAEGNIDGAVLMGRASYACRQRLDRLLDGIREDPSFGRGLRDALDRAGGELDAVPREVWGRRSDLRARLVCPTRDAVCAGCRLRGDCYMYRARRRAVDARVVFANHALLFSDLAASGALLGEYGVLVLDEAHHVEDVATDFFTVSYSPRSVRGSVHSVYDPDYEETVRYIRAMVAAESEEDAETVDDLWGGFHDAMRRADRSTDALFERLAKNTEKMGPDVKTNSRNGPVQVVYQEGAPLFYDADTAASDVVAALEQMAGAAGALSELAENSETLTQSGVGGAMDAIAGAAAETRARFEFLIGGTDENHVFYARLDPASAVTALSASPVDMRARLGANLEEGARATVLTSATLAVGDDFSFFVERYGLEGCERVATHRFESPFDLKSGRLVLVPSFLPEPDRAGFVEMAAGLIDRVSDELGRRILVLCTARSQVDSLLRLLGRRKSRPMFAQTDGASRSQLLEDFRRSRGGLLAGLASFWEGIDLPGDELELLVILKLPFLVPTGPVTQARTRLITESGENAFEKLFIPDVVLKLRQGMGRLIRTGHDRGAVILLDSRLSGSRYGDTVLGAVTGSYERCDNQEKVIEHLKRFFER